MATYANRLNVLTIAGVLLVGTALASMQKPPAKDHEHEELTLDVQLTLLTSASRERFRPLMGYRVEMRPGGGWYYESTRELPEAAWCRVYEHPRLSFVCEWSRNRKRAFSEFAKTYQDALGTGWKRTDTERKSGKLVRFDYPDRRGDLSMELSESAAGIRLTLNAPGE